MTEKEKYAIALVKNCYDYLTGKISESEIEQLNYDYSYSYLSFPIVKIQYMQSVLKDNFFIQIMNNILKYQCFNFRNHHIYSLRNSVEMNKNKVTEICNNIVSYVFNHIDLQFEMFKQMIPNQLNQIIMNAYVLDYIEPIDVYYCKQYINIKNEDEYLERFFKYCDKHVKIAENNFVKKIEDVLKKIIKKYEEMI